MSDKLAYRVKEAAAAIGISRAKAYELIAAGEMPSIRIGSSLRVPTNALRDWIARKQNAEKSPSADVCTTGR